MKVNRIKNKDTKELIIMVIAMIIMYLCFTISQVFIVMRTFDKESEKIQQELNNSNSITESIQR